MMLVALSAGPHRFEPTETNGYGLHMDEYRSLHVCGAVRWEPSPHPDSLFAEEGFPPENLHLCPPNT